MKIKNLKINKVQKYVNILILLFLVIAFVYFVGIKITEVFKKVDKLTYTTLQEKFSSTTLVTDYNQFYTIDGILSQFIVACQNEKYSELYDVMVEKYKKTYSLSEAKEILEGYRQNNFYKPGNENYYESQGRLKSIYMIDDLYILIFNDINGNEMYLAIQMGSSKYKFTFIETE